ncbi:MAG TPA: hypothetical protein VHU80_20455, partial [Polyangiaceae bacterium]|nr:hypothetical protein [Polyangiaceae bacterium]
MTLKIETTADGRAATIRLIGRIDVQYLPELEAQVSKHRPRLVLDLDELTLVDVAVVRFFERCEAAGIELANCAAYIREWMDRERDLERRLETR